jgi:hypothetical protein
VKFREILRIPLDGWSISAIPGNQGCWYASKNPDILFRRRFLKNKMEQRSSARVRSSASAEVIRDDLVESTLVMELSLRGCYPR